MASLHPERDTTPSAPTTIATSTGLEVFDNAESEINSHFLWLHQILNERNVAILYKLRQKRAEFVELERSRVEHIEEIETMKQQILNIGVKSNMTNLLREQTLTGYDAAIDDLKRPIQTEKIIFEKFDDKLHTLISSIDVKFIEEGHNIPIISVHRDSIIQSINKLKLVQPKSSKGWAWGKAKGKNTVQKLGIFKLAFDSETNHIFALNSNNILVFEQDGTLIACFGEEFKDVIDICIDTNNKVFYVMETVNLIYKFDLITYQLVKKKEISGKEVQSLDVHNDEIYVGTCENVVDVFSSELEHIRYISISGILIIDILCRDDDIIINSFLPNEVNIYSYSGDFIRNIPLSFVMGISEMEKLEITVSFQFDIDKSGLLLFTNPIGNCLNFQTFSGHLVQKIDILPQEDGTLISGVVCTKEGRIFVSVANSEYPLRCY